MQGIVPATIHEYYTWTGRWGAAGLNYLLTSSFDLVGFYTPLLLIIPFLLATSVFLLLRAARIGATRTRSFALAAAAAALYWNGMPDPGETVYWLTGSVDNLTGFVLSFALLAALLRFDVSGTVSRAAASAALFLLAFLATGFHEVFGLVLCAALASGSLQQWLARRSNRWIWTGCLAAALIGFLVVYAAPGNEVRRADFPFAGNLEVTVRLALGQSFSSIFMWISDIRLLTGTLLLLMLMPRDLTASNDGIGLPARNVVITGITGIAAVGGAFTAVSWAIGMSMAPRTLNGIYLVFLVGLFWVIVLSARCFPAAAAISAARPAARWALTVLFVGGMMLSGNTRKAIVDLSVAAPVYRAAMQERWRSLAAASDRGERAAVGRSLPARPKCFIKYFELSEDPEFWVNWGVAHYFGLASVKLSAAEAEPNIPADSGSPP
ncbi:MAG TPA: DUF6056 family protein [Pyrinomonadaceae bacterium]